MKFATDLLTDSAGGRNSDAEISLSAFRQALETGDHAGLTVEQRELAGRIAQATAKIDSGAEIARLSELTTLAQFAAGSAGKAVANAFDDPAGAPVLEGLMTARFLTRIVLSANRHPHLIPDDLLRAANVARDALDWPRADPVYRELLDRAALAAKRASAGRNEISSAALRKYFDRQQAQTIRQIRKLAGKDPDSPRARLNAFDRIIVSLTILLHIRGTP